MNLISTFRAAMVALPQHKMTVDEYLAWAEDHPGRYELYAGTVYAMSPERALHGKVKYAVQTALLAGIKRNRLPCHMLPDGMTVRVDIHTAYEPDALVYCGGELPDQAVEIPNPVVVVEVLSRSTRRIDSGAKLAGYFNVASVRHYIVVDADRRVIVHHQKTDEGPIRTAIVREGVLALSPPGIELALGDIFPDSAATSGSQDHPTD